MSDRATLTGRGLPLIAMIVFALRRPLPASARRLSRCTICLSAALLRLRVTQPFAPTAVRQRHRSFSHSGAPAPRRMFTRTAPLMMRFEKRFCGASKLPGPMSCQLFAIAGVKDLSPEPDSASSSGVSGQRWPRGECGGTRTRRCSAPEMVDQSQCNFRVRAA